MDKTKAIFNGFMAVFKNKAVFWRFFVFIMLIAIILGGHRCATPWGNYEYKSPLESWLTRK
jgi:hypothetical protein